MKKILLSTLTLFSVSTLAKIPDGLTITPIVGFEKVQRVLPTPTMKTRTVFGARALYRLPITSLEAEYTHGDDTSTDVATSTTYKFVDDKLRVGIRGDFDMASFLSWNLSGGMQMKQTKTTRTVSGTSSTSSTSTTTDPYVGTGLSLHILNAFSLNADVTAVYTPTDDPALDDYEIRPTLGFSIRI